MKHNYTLTARQRQQVRGQIARKLWAGQTYFFVEIEAGMGVQIAASPESRTFGATLSHYGDLGDLYEHGRVSYPRGWWASC